MRKLTLTLAVSGLITAAVTTGPASATAKPASDALVKTTSSQYAKAAFPTAVLRGAGLYATALPTAPWATEVLGEQSVASRTDPFLAPTDDLVAFSMSCTKGGYCCFWFMEGSSPYCG